VTVISPPRRPGTEQDRDLEQRVADLEALIEEARRRARRRWLRNWGATLLVAAAGAAGLIGFGGHGGGGAGGAAALAQAPGAQSPAANAGSPPLGALPQDAGGAQAFAFDSRNPQVVYVLTVSGNSSRGHVFKTTDGGAHWHATATSGSGWVGDIQTLTADPRHPGTLYAGTTVAVYKTVDGGRNWRPYNQGLFPPLGGRRVCYRPTGGSSYCVKQPFGTAGTPHFNRGNGWVTAIAVDPSNTSIVYSGADAVRKSTDGGHSWKTVFLFDPAGSRWLSNVSALAIAPTRPESIYAIANASNGHTSHTSIFKSTDAGKTWRATGAGKVFTNQDGWGGAVAVDPQHPTTVYASIGQTLVRTTDAGASWQPITQGLPQQVVTALTVDPKQPGTVYAGLYPTYNKNVISAPGGIYKTTNGGDTWTHALTGITPDAVAVDPARPTTIYAVVKEGLARSTDGGRTWTTAP
jgi:photosystem II stability/assembly factor-like uncharacterized protein